jgi:hypothetical protein
MQFSIVFKEIESRLRKRRVSEAYGTIRIGLFEETFHSNLTFWQPQDYTRHWLEACDRVLKTSHASSALITSMEDPDSANFITWWPLYREGQKVYIQNHLLLFDQLKEPFRLENPFVHVPARETKDEGTKISEWETDLGAIREFCEESGGKMVGH